MKSNRYLPPNYSILSRFQFLSYGGAPLSDELCLRLIEHNVHLVNVYGSTETVEIIMKLFAPIIEYILEYLNDERSECTTDTLEMDEIWKFTKTFY